MDVLLQTHGAKRVFPVPDGLRELTSDIVREVLRHQPECIHSFIAEYLETMLVVREKARDSAAVVSDIFRQGYFFDDLYRKKKVTREEANVHASVIQAGWRGYVVRKKLRLYLQKRRKIQEEKELKKSMKIEEFLESIGITYEEATRAACLIQAAYRQARRGKWIVNESGEEVWLEGEGVPFGQRIKEGDITQGRYDRWEKKDWGDFFQLNEEGEIIYDWPRVGQLHKIPRKLVTPDMEIVQFYAMRDLQGKEQYSYLKGPQKGRDPRGFPIGFLIPLPKDCIGETSLEVNFVNPVSDMRMGTHGYVFEKSVEKPDLGQFVEVLKERKSVREKTFPEEIQGEFDYDPYWVVPKILVQIRKDCLTDTDDEVVFLNEEAAPQTNGVYTFRAENADASLKVMEFLLKSNCGTVEEAMADASNINEYRQKSTGRLIAVDDFKVPKYIQKVIIQQETKTGERENKDMDNYEYVFVPRRYKWRKRAPKPENPIKIPLTRFQGHKSTYLGSNALDNQVFIMGPMFHSVDGKPVTYQSLFWDEFGPECWYQLLCTITTKKIARLGEAAEEEEQGEQEELEEEQEEEHEIEGEQEESQKEAESGETAQSPETSKADLAKPETTEVEFIQQRGERERETESEPEAKVAEPGPAEEEKEKEEEEEAEPAPEVAPQEEPETEEPEMDKQ